MKVSIVIVEYYSLDELLKCFESLPKGFSCDVEIIVSSNSCYTEEEQEEILQRFPHFVWSFNERNGGFAYAMNHGLRVATGDYLIIANPDCVFLDKLDGMLEFIDQHQEVGAIAPQIIDSKGIIQDTARSYVSVQSFVWRQIRRLILKKESIRNPLMDYSKVQTVDWIIGAFIMVPRDVYLKTRGLSDEYYMYAEDLDWCTRIRQNGWEVVYYPRVKIQYKGTRSARKNKKSARIFLRSHLTFWMKFGFFFGYPRRKKIVFED